MRLLIFFLFLHLCTTAQAQDVLPNVSSGKLIRIANFQSKYITQRNIDIWFIQKVRINLEWLWKLAAETIQF